MTEFAVDIASHADERPFGISKLDRQTRPDAHTSSDIGVDIPRPVQSGRVLAAEEDRHTDDVTVDHVERYLVVHVHSFRGSRTVQNFCPFVHILYYIFKYSNPYYTRKLF